MKTVVELPDLMWLSVIEFLDFSSIVAWAKGVGLLGARKRCQDHLQPYAKVLGLIKIAYITNLSQINTTNFLLMKGIKEVHFYNLMKNLSTLPAVKHSFGGTMDEHAGSIPPRNVAAAIVQFVCQFPACTLVTFWGSRNAMKKDFHAVNHIYAGALMDEFSWAFCSGRLDHHVSILGMKCPLSSVSYNKMYQPDGQYASKSCKHCSLACKYWPINEVARFRSTYSCDGRYDIGGICAPYDEPFNSVCPEPNYLDICQDFDYIQKSLEKRSHDGFVLDPMTRLLNAMSSATVHKFKPVAFPGLVYCFVSLNIPQVCWMTRILKQTNFDIKSLSGEDIKHALMGPPFMKVGAQEKWYILSENILTEQFELTLEEEDWPHHFLPKNKYSPLEAMTLSVMYNLGNHIPHLEVDSQIREFHHIWKQSLRGYGYEEMLGLGFKFSSRKTHGGLEKGKSYILTEDSKNGFEVTYIRDHSNDTEEKYPPAKKIRIGNMTEGLSRWTACDFFPCKVVDLMGLDQKIVQL